MLPEIETRGIEPRSAGYQPAALPLSYVSGVLRTNADVRLSHSLRDWLARQESNLHHRLRTPASFRLDDEPSLQAAVTRACDPAGRPTGTSTQTARVQGVCARIDTIGPWSAWRDFNPRSLPWQGSVFSTRPHAQRIAPSPRREGACTDSAPLSKSVAANSASSWCTGLDLNQDLSGFNRALFPLSYRSLGAGADSNRPFAFTEQRAALTPTRTNAKRGPASGSPRK